MLSRQSQGAMGLKLSPFHGVLSAGVGINSMISIVIDI